MSGHLQRNVIRNKFKFNKNLPDIPDMSFNSPKRKVIDRSFYDFKNSANKDNDSRTNYDSVASSARSQRYQDLFYRNDWPSLSDTETCDSPDFYEQEESDSSGSSMFSWADIEGTRKVSEEWEKIQRTLYDEEGLKVTQQHLIDECNQWKAIFPHLRIMGRGFTIKDPDFEELYETEEEVLVSNYDSDVNPDGNSYSALNDQENTLHRLFGENMPIYNKISNQSDVKDSSVLIKNKDKLNYLNVFDDLDTILRISPVTFNFHDNNFKKRNKTSSIVKSEISSSKWRHRNVDSPDFVSLPYQDSSERNQTTRDSSASSFCNFNFSNLLSRNLWSGFVKYDKKGFSESNKFDKSQMLEPIETSAKKSLMISNHELHNTRSSTASKNKNISLPPINSRENKVKKKAIPDSGNSLSGKSQKWNKTVLTPLEVSSSVPKHNIKIDVDALSLFNNRSAVANNQKNQRKK